MTDSSVNSQDWLELCSHLDVEQVFFHGEVREYDVMSLLLVLTSSGGDESRLDGNQIGQEPQYFYWAKTSSL